MFGWFRKTSAYPVPDRLYERIVSQARQPVFYRELGVADTPDGRFDMIIVHAWLVMRRIRSGGDESVAFSQALFDFMFKDMDRNLRELGVGDLAVGKRIKGMAQGFFGRVQSYDHAIDAGDVSALCKALRRNVYRGQQPTEAQVAALAEYVVREERSLAQQEIPVITDGGDVFGVLDTFTDNTGSDAASAPVRPMNDR